jgi:DNA-directed RNA polymerase specialized sigma24 family protein
MTNNATIDNDCTGAGLVKAQDAAIELFQVAALMLGSEADALTLVEHTVSQIEIDPCAQEEVTSAQVRRQLVGAAVARMKQRDPQAFLAPPSSDPANGSCIEDDDLSAAGISSADLAELVSGAGRQEMRVWLEKLPLAQRAIFIQRAVLGWDNGATAETLKQGSDAGSGWQPHQVSDVFRQALCSLANSLVHSAATQRLTA